MQKMVRKTMQMQDAEEGVEIEASKQHAKEGMKNDASDMQMKARKTVQCNMQKWCGK